MIAKHVPMRSLGKSDFAGLVSYLTDAQSKDHRLGQVQITNCDAVSVQDAITEILATQHTNPRANGDKTYHLIVSFRAGEQPGADTLRAIEERICVGLGYSEHQRVSAVHNDTDNLHIHIAINKIHPTRHTMHEPYYSHRALAELCTTLERDYGLERDNHEPRRRGAEGRAADMERHSGQESLSGWIKRECLAEIKSAASWAELHQVMRENGLTLRARGNGLVIEAGDGTTIKASTVARDLSKSALEKRFGVFEASPEHQAAPTRRGYQKGQPMRLRGGLDTTELYARYKDAQQGLTATRAGALAEAKRQKDKAVENAKKAAAMRRAAIKHLTDGRLTKRLLYGQASAALRADLAAIHERHNQERAAIYLAHSRRTWADWLKQQAIAGDGQAIDALRAREAAQGLKGDTLQGEGVVKAGRALVIDNITKKGTIIYRAGSSAVRDDGERLAVSSEADRAGVLAALRMAMERYGERITVSGSVAFKATAIRAAVDARLPIVFTDPILERRRLVEAAKAQARVRPGAPPVGRQPPPHRRHGLRTLGQLGGLYIEGGAQRPAQAPRPAPMPAKVRPSAPSELAQREARLRAQMEAKRAKRQENGKGRGR